MADPTTTCSSDVLDNTSVNNRECFDYSIIVHMYIQLDELYV